MWISRKEYKFLREKAEKNIDAECAILMAKERNTREVERMAKEYSAVLEERDSLRLEVIDLQQQLMLVRNGCENFEEYLTKNNK